MKRIKTGCGPAGQLNGFAWMGRVGSATGGKTRSRGVSALWALLLPCLLVALLLAGGQYPIRTSPERAGRAAAIHNAVPLRAAANVLPGKDVYPSSKAERKFKFENNGGKITITEYLGSEHNVVIPNNIDGVPVCALGYQAFANKSFLRSVRIPDGVTTIEGAAFAGNASGLTVYIPQSVMEIERDAFDETPGIVLEIEKENQTYQFKDDALLSRDGKVLHIYTGSDGVYTIPDGVQEIGAAFYGKDMTKVTIPSGVTRIGTFAFYGCSNMTEIVLPDSLEVIEPDAFIYCGLKSLVIPEGVTHIEDEAFFGNRDLISVSIPDSVKKIGSLAFAECSSLKSFVVPKGVTRIADYTFSFCTSLISITIPEGVFAIGSNAFENCSALRNITIPTSVDRIAQDAFTGCGRLTVKVASGSQIYQLRGGVLYLYGTMEMLMAFPSMLKGAYTVPAGVSVIPEKLFSECDKLTKVVLPDSVHTIENNAFQRCSALTAVTLPGGLSKLGAAAFLDCKAIKSISIPGSVSSISSRAFFGCDSLAKLEIGEGVKEIGKDSFSGCSSLGTVIIPQSVSTIDTKCFQDCGNVLAYTYHDSFANGLAKEGVNVRKIDSCIQQTELFIGKKTVSAYAVRLTDFSKFEWDKFYYTGARISMDNIETSPRCFCGTVRNCHGMEYSIEAGLVNYGWPYSVPWRSLFRLSNGSWSRGDVRSERNLTAGEKVTFSVLFAKPVSITAWAEEPISNLRDAWQTGGGSIYRPTLYFATVPDAQNYLDSIS